MNVLFLDDDAYRCAKAQSRMPFAEIVKTAQAAIVALSKRNAWDVVCLDHDLSGEQMVRSDGTNTGFEVVRWIVRNRPAIRCVVIHSFNVPASIAMEQALQNVGYRTYRATFSVAMLDEVGQIWAE